MRKQQPSCRSGTVDQPVHPLQVPSHADQTPLALNSLNAAQAELPETKGGPDDPEHRLNRRLALRINPFPLSRAHPVRHALNSIAIGRKVRLRRPPLQQWPVVALPAGGNEWRNIAVVAQFNVPAAEICRIGNKTRRPAKTPVGIRKSRKRRGKLADVIRIPACIGTNNHVAVMIHRGLGVAGLLQAAGRRYDPGVRIGETDLVLRTGTRHRRPWRPAARLAITTPFPFTAPFHHLLIDSLLGRMTGYRTELQLPLGLGNPGKTP